MKLVRRSAGDTWDPLEIMKDNIFDALANEHRRTLLVALLGESPQKATVPPSVEVDAGALEPKSRVEIALYHTHLPKLEEYGFIRWNRDTQEIAKGQQYEEIRPLLECVDGRV